MSTRDDLPWMRSVVTDRGLKDVRDCCLERFLELARGDRRMAVEAISSIHAGKTYQPLRELLGVA